MKIYYVDSFTKEPFKGNPAAVVIVDNHISDSTMQSIAREIGFSETAFLQTTEAGKHSLRWFTPTTEVSLCGHATLATAKIFFTYLHPEESSVEFITKYGTITCSHDYEYIKMDMQCDKLQEVDIHNRIKHLFAFPLNKSIFFSEFNHYLTLIVDDEVDLKRLTIKPAEIMELDCLIPEIRGLILSNQAAGIVKMRFFDPWEGIDEDPVTGSAALVVAEYWFKRFGKDNIEIEQLSQRGGKMFVNKSKTGLTIMGTATVILEGVLMVGDYGK